MRSKKEAKETLLVKRWENICKEKNKCARLTICMHFFYLQPTIYSWSHFIFFLLRTITQSFNYYDHTNIQCPLLWAIYTLVVIHFNFHDGEEIVTNFFPFVFHKVYQINPQTIISPKRYYLKLQIPIFWSQEIDGDNESHQFASHTF